MGYGLDGWSSIRSRSKTFLSFPQRPNKFWGPPSLLSKGYLGSAFGGKEAGVVKQTTHLEVKNGGAISPLAIYCDVYTCC
jgi:hypothetical protein